MDPDRLIKQVADSVREAIDDAEKQAAQIVRDAEKQAADIRSRAEVEARERIEGARKALEELGGKLAPTEPAAKEPPPEPAAKEPPPEPSPPKGPPRDDVAEVEGPDDAEEGVKLVAFQLALDGKSRQEIESKLAEDFGATDRGKLLDDVLARVPK